MSDQSIGAPSRMAQRSPSDQQALTEILHRMQAEGLETLRLSFVDQHGVLRGKTLVTEALPGVFRDGMAMTSTLLLKDPSHKTVFPVWSGGTGIGHGLLEGAGDILLLPDPGTFRRLPGDMGGAWMLCDLAYKDGRPLPFDPRGLLKAAVAKLAAHDMEMRVGIEVEFTLYDQTTPPRPADRGFQYLTESRFDALEPVLDHMRRDAAALGLPIRTLEVEMGPGQVEMTFAPMSPLESADALSLFRRMARRVAGEYGLTASFMCRPKTERAVPSGWHVHQSLLNKAGDNLFQSADGTLTRHASGWMAGLMARAVEGCLLSTPTVNGYKRFQPGMLAPDRVLWGRDNKGAMLRALLGPGNPASRIENRVAESLANPYLFLAGQIEAGLDGIVSDLRAPDAVEHPYCTDADLLPRDLGAAIRGFEQSEFFRTAFGTEVVDWLVTLKRAEWTSYLDEVSDWEQRSYFDLL